ncbi:MAG: ABC transporter ATP-binding protein [Candidatus Methylomirabilia bacterium]
MSAGVPILEVRGFRICKGGADLLNLPFLAVARGETLSLIGPNGAGKSTLLLGLSGIEQPFAGELLFRGERVPAGAAALAYRRRVAMVFQEPLLFDTTVFENVATGLRLRSLPQAEIARRATESLERFKVRHLADRSARTLSGGEAQRVSLARALAVAPEILLLDEPFAALDPPAREALLEDLAHTLHETGTTTVFATHDRTEAQRIADRVAVLDCGRLRQIGTAEEVLRRPVDAGVAAFVGVENLLPIRLVAAGAGGTFAAVFERIGALEGGTAPGCASLEIGGVATGMRVGSAGLLCVRPEDVLIAAPGDRRGSSANQLQGRVAAVTAQGPFLKVSIDCGVRIVAAVSGHLARELALEPGRAMTIALRPADLYVIPRG